MNSLEEVPSPQRFDRYLRLPDVYQRLGKADFRDDWVDYQILTYLDSQPMLFDASAFVRPKDQEIDDLEKIEKKKSLFKKPSKEDLVRHEAFFEKGFRKQMNSSSLVSFGRALDGRVYIIPKRYWLDYSGNTEIDILHSRIKNAADNADLHVLVDPAKLRSFEKDVYKHSVQDAVKRPKGGGAPTNEHWPKVDQIIKRQLGLYAKSGRRLNKSEITRLVIRQLVDQGIPLSQLPGEEALRKRINVSK